MRRLFVVLVNVFLFVNFFRAIAGREESISKLWEPLLSVNSKCRRFVQVVGNNDGLGDQLERMFVALTLAWRHRDDGVTLALSDDFGKHSMHGSGYLNVMKGVFGLPMDKIRRASAIMEKFKPTMINMEGTKFGEYMTHKRKFTDDTPCDTITVVDIFDACGGHWCPLLWLEQISEGLGELLPETYARNGGYCRRYNMAGASSQLNVVWHIRVFDHVSASHTCRSCKPGYFSGLDTFVGAAVADLNNRSTRAGGVMLTRKDIVVHREVKSTISQTDVLQPLKNATRIHSEDLKEVLCTLANADLLVTTGSSLPATLVYFLPKHRPVVLEEARLTNDAYLFGTNPHKSFPYFPFKHAMPPGRSFHMLNGQPDQNVTEAAIAEALVAFMK
jgi:hypothetical protein